jgi:hypothetical protein
MMQIMNIITDKPDWDRKVFDQQITDVWREEAAQSGQDATPKMMDYIIQELQWKTGILSKMGFVEVFDDGVVKSDTAISKELQTALRKAVLPFENVPEDEKDYHPSSDQKVVDLVHPSLFPLIYGRTHILPDRVIGLDDCLSSMGEGYRLCNASETEASFETIYSNRNAPHPPGLSTKFQWLPCDVKLTEDAECRIMSYINSAHPIKHRALYEIIEKILTKTMPLWEKSLSERPSCGERIKFTKVVYEDDGVPEPECTHGDDDTEDKEYEERLDAWYESRKIILPEPKEFNIAEPLFEDVNLLKHFPEGNFQVIVKLSKIELTPEKPDYEGGTWHIEGQLVRPADHKS